MEHRAAAVASRGIELAIRGESFTAEDILKPLSSTNRHPNTTPPSRSTVYRVLRQLEDDEWIEQRGNGWHPDIKSKMLRSGKNSNTADENSNNKKTDFNLDLDEIL